MSRGEPASLVAAILTDLVATQYLPACIEAPPRAVESPGHLLHSKGHAALGPLPRLLMWVTCLQPVSVYTTMDPADQVLNRPHSLYEYAARGF